MKRARLVVIRAGSSVGLLWELEQAVQVLNPKKVVILVLNMWPKKYETFRKEAERTFKCAFPKANEIRRFWRVSGFIRFSANWEPTFLPLRMPYYRGSIYKPYRRLFKFALLLFLAIWVFIGYIASLLDKKPPQTTSSSFLLSKH
jgi:hypothetical protein